MKKILTLISLVVVFASCGELESLNENTKDFTTVPGEALFNGAARQFSNQLLTCNVNNNNTQLFAQYWTETTYTDESRYDMVTRTIPAAHSNVLYRNVLANLKEAKRVLATQSLSGIDPKQRENQIAECEILMIMAYSNLIETYGDMPYTEALDYTNPFPKYDDGLTVYKALFTRLDAAIATLTANKDFAGLGTYDNLLGGSTAKWTRFANSLKLRMALILADVPAEAANAKALAEAAAPKVFIPGDRCAQVYLSAAPNTHPLYTELVQSGRSDFVVANTLVNKMNTLNDPRLSLYFTTVGGAYKGGTYGAPSAYGSFSHVNPTLVTTTREGLLMDYFETEFLLAEAAERGFTVPGSAASHYNNAISASIIYWGGTQTQADVYLAQSTVNYATAAGNWREKIGTQAWIAYWFNGMTAWTSWRRLDYPRLIATPLHVPDVAGIPMRYIYPVSEQTLNPTSYKNAAAAIGGDNAMTRLFWDKGPDNYNTLTGK